MAVMALPTPIEEASRVLAEASRESEPELLRTYWFRNADEIRLVHVDPNSYPNERVTPFYFGISRNTPFRSAIALVRPEEAEDIALPPEWGDWQSAEIWVWH